MGPAPPWSLLTYRSVGQSVLAPVLSKSHVAQSISAKVPQLKVMHIRYHCLVLRGVRKQSQTLSGPLPVQDSTTMYETLAPEVADHVVGLCNRVTRTLLDMFDG
jgi:hypothetical protein